MALVELVFRQAATGGGTAELVFGAAEQVADAEFRLAAALPAPVLGLRLDPAATFAVDGVLPALALDARIAAVVQARLDTALPAPVFSARIGPPTWVELDTALPGPTVTLLVGRPVGVGFDAVLPLPVLAVVGRYDVGVDRPLVGRLRAPHQAAQSAPTGTQFWFEDSLARGGGVQSVWRETQARPSVITSPSRDGVRLPSAGRRPGHHNARPFDAWSAGSTFADGLRDRRVDLRSSYALARHIGRPLGDRWQELLRHARPAHDESWGEGGRVRWSLGQRVGAARLLHGARRSRFEAAMRPPAGRRTVPPPPPPSSCYTPTTALLFAGAVAVDGHLLFVCERFSDPTTVVDPIVVPIRRLYFVINDVSLRRAADGAPVPVASLSLSLDADSWAWGFDAVLPMSAQALVDPGIVSGPVELLARVNGTDFKVLAETISRERVFGEASVRVSGRGHNAVLAAPYAPVLSFSNALERTAQQLMDDVLTLNGVPLGWTVDWGLEDWNVPGGVFAVQGTWIEALSSISAAAGGYLIPDRIDQALRVRHRFPVAPWEWGTVSPDFVLPVDAVARESLRWLDKPAYNRVFVSGQEVGVLGQVTRAGTAGNVVAPMVVDPLITQAAAARQRGLAVLADTGRQIEVSLRLPVIAETGVIEPGSFVEYRDGAVTRLGLVRSTQVQAAMPEVWQTLGVQAYA